MGSQGSYDFIAHVSGKIKGRYAPASRNLLAFESEGRTLRGAFDGLVGQARGAGTSIWDPYDEAIALARGNYLAPAHIGEDEEENNASCGPTKQLPAYSRACWSLARTTTGDLKEVDALLIELFPEPLVSVQKGLWRPTSAGLSYLDFVNDCDAEKVRLGLDMLPAVDSLIVSCITGGTIQTNLPLIREAVCLGLMDSVGSGEAAKMSEQGFTWFFLGGAGLVDTGSRKKQTRIWELSRALAFPDYGDRANLIGRLPTYALGELIRVTQKQPNLVSVVVDNLPLSKWAALSVQIRDLEVHREITRGLKRKHHIQ
jgi:hypothetical protein